MTISVSKKSFTGGKNLHGEVGLGAILVQMAQDLARMKVDALNPTALTDNSTGVNGSAVVALPIPTSAFDASSAGGATRTAFNTAVDKFENAGKSFVTNLSVLRVAIGLPAVTAASGTDTPNTIPAQDKSVATTSGLTSLPYIAGVAAMKQVASNAKKLAIAVDEVAYALGASSLPDSLSTELSGTKNILEAVADVAVSTDATKSVSKAAVDAFLNALANNVASLAAKVNAIGTAYSAAVALQVSAVK